MLRAMFISGLGLDTSQNIPVVILNEIEGERTLCIRIGMYEAPAIASELEGIQFPRPLTHDLLKNIMQTLDVNVRGVEVRELRNNNLYALVNLHYHGREISLDSKISDALALALRVNAPIYVVEEVIQNAAQITLEKEAADTSDLESLSPEVFGKYKI
jgi:bifunctional DNase/RNase